MSTAPEVASNAYTVKVEGPHNEDADDRRQKLLSQLETIPKDVKFLRIIEDTPSDTEWAILGDHFTSVTELEMDTGFDEALNDAKMPLHWPLKRYEVASACGELVRSPFILEGKVEHLNLLAAHKEAVAKGEKEPKHLNVTGDNPEGRKIEFIYIPELASQWMTKHIGQSGEVQLPPPKQTNTKLLEIIENDAIDTFNRMAIPMSDVIFTLRTLNIRSTEGLDFNYTAPKMFSSILTDLEALHTLVLSVGEVFDGDGEDELPFQLYKFFPPNLTTLRFRGPVSLVTSEHWHRWVESFRSLEYLPNLKTLSFVLDLDYGEDNPSSTPRRKKIKPTDERIRKAKAACEELYDAAQERDILIEPFVDKWNKRNQYLDQVDDRWETL
ncbi:hypothetical protein PRK78_004027 [Emydomyces testavorans]|uniref:Uncharacterized protein n=1 Tax=Emydomyces testavorans TaxID=2070801 RepID=A0AAF0IL65_9EURO|nr:hypothetical protein PRK78_004027 [Emydomyces testavorans]